MSINYSKRLFKNKFLFSCLYTVYLLQNFCEILVAKLNSILLQLCVHIHYIRIVQYQIFKYSVLCKHNNHTVQYSIFSSQENERFFRSQENERFFRSQEAAAATGSEKLGVRWSEATTNCSLMEQLLQASPIGIKLEQKLNNAFSEMTQMLYKVAEWLIRWTKIRYGKTQGSEIRVEISTAKRWIKCDLDLKINEWKFDPSCRRNNEWLAF